MMVRSVYTTFLLLVAFSWPVLLSGQTNDPHRWIDGGAGLMFDSPDGLDGPILYVRSLQHPVPWFALGPRFEFRDDDPGRGRAQVVSGGVEAVLAPLDGILPLHVYVPVHLALDLQYVQGEVRSRRVDTGIFPRVSAGIGVNIGAGRGRLRFERRWSISAGGDFNAVVVGFGTTAGIGTPSQTRVYLVGHELFPAGGTYAREPDYRGYSVVYQRAAGGWVDAWRGSLGVDFVDFTYSTGVITALVGPLKTVVRAGTAMLNLVGQVGATRFAEGGNVSFPLAWLVGVEGEVGFGSAALVVGVGVWSTNGPAGWVIGLQPRFGIAVGM